MADPLGIVGLIGVVAQIIEIGVQFGQDWRDVPADVKVFLAELQALRVTLSETNENVIHNQDFKDAFQGRHSTLLSQVGDEAPPETDAKTMLSICEVELRKVIDLLERRDRGHRLGWERLKGALLARKTREAVETLHRQCQAFNRMAAIDAIALSANTHRQVKEIREVVENMHSLQLSREDEDERKAALDWLTTVDYAPQHSDFLSRRQPGTGGWLLDSKVFTAWLETDKTTLLCPGIPGAGKTILTAIVIDDLARRFKTERDIGIAYLYCNFRRRDEQKATDLLASLLKQLSQRGPSLPDHVKMLHDEHKGKGTRPSLEEVSRALQSVAATYSRVFIIIDALDECQEFEGSRSRFLEKIFDLQYQSGVNIFATSRFIPEITEKFDGDLTVEVRASEQDVRKYLDGHIFRLPGFVARSPELQEEVKTGIVQSVRGMFLLAQPHLDSLVGTRSIKALRAAVKKLSSRSDACDTRTSYDHAYNDAMERIEGQVRYQEELAKQVLSWITCARRPLTTIELQHALAVEVGEPKLDEENLPEDEDLVSVCAGLVTIDMESNIIRLVHYTTQDYFTRHRKRWFPDAEAEITTICITYLSFNTFESGYCESDDSLDARLKANPLYDYISHNWGHHAREASATATTTFVAPHLAGWNRAILDATAQVLTSRLKWDRFWRYSQTSPKKMTSIHLAAYFGVREIVIDLIRMGLDFDVGNSHGRTALSYAAEKGHVAVVKLLLEEGASVDVMDIHGQVPLVFAVHNGHEAVVKLLLEKGANIEATDRVDRTLVNLAAMRGLDNIVTLLLAKGADPEAVNYNGSTPLSLAAQNGHCIVVKLLLENGADIEATDSDERTPLSHAAENGHAAIVQLLLENGADIDVEDFYEQTPLSHATRKGHKAVVKLLSSGRGEAPCPPGTLAV